MLDDLPDAPLETIRRLDAAGTEAALDGLADLLADAVAGGASVNFLAGFDAVAARAWWRRAVLPGVAAGERLLFVAEIHGRVVGTVQLVPAPQPNQPHRAEIGKMIVHARARRRGIGARLLAAAEDAARDLGRTLLTLDTESGSAGEALYRREGWILVGAVPGYALNPVGVPMPASFFYKVVAPPTDPFPAP